MHDFDQVVDRGGTGSLKWDRYARADVLPLWVADMDFRAPPAVVDALKARADHGIFGYTMPYDDVVDEALAYLQTRHGIEAQPEWLVWYPGMVPALNVACRALAAPGEGVMTATPIYPPFLSAPAYSGRQLQAVPLRLEGGDTWTFDFVAMEAAVTDRTRLFSLCNPHNPVGRVFRRDELEEFAKFCIHHDLIICSDEIHCDLILDDVEHIPLSTIGPEIHDRTITLHAPSKTYNLPGLCCAYAVIPNAKLRLEMKKTARGMITEVNAFGYAGCAAAYRHGEPWRKELIAYLKGNRDLLYDFVSTRIPGIVLHPMQATYLAWMDIRALNLEQPVSFFTDHGVGLSDGAHFGDAGFLRINFGCPRATLQEALNRMESAVRTLQDGKN